MDPTPTEPTPEMSKGPWPRPKVSIKSLMVLVLVLTLFNALFAWGDRNRIWPPGMAPGDIEWWRTKHLISLNGFVLGLYLSVVLFAWWQNLARYRRGHPPLTRDEWARKIVRKFSTLGMFYIGANSLGRILTEEYPSGWHVFVLVVWVVCVVVACMFLPARFWEWAFTDPIPRRIGTGSADRGTTSDSPDDDDERITCEVR